MVIGTYIKYIYAMNWQSEWTLDSVVTRPTPLFPQKKYGFFPLWSMRDGVDVFYLSESSCIF